MRIERQTDHLMPLFGVFGITKSPIRVLQRSKPTCYLPMPKRQVSVVLLVLVQERRSLQLDICEEVVVVERSFGANTMSEEANENMMCRLRRQRRR